MNLSFFLSLATFRIRSSACDTLSRLCVRRVLCWPAFPLVPALGSTGSAALGPAADRSAGGRSALFAGFTATMAWSDFSCPYIIGYGILAFPMRTAVLSERITTPAARYESSQVPIRSLCT